MAGKTRIKEQPLIIGDEDLAKLTPEERLELARIIEGEYHHPLGKIPGDCRLVAPTFDEVQRALAARATASAEKIRQEALDKEHLDAEQRGAAERLSQLPKDKWVRVEGDNVIIHHDLVDQRDNPYCQDIFKEAMSLCHEAHDRIESIKAQEAAAAQAKENALAGERRMTLHRWVQDCNNEALRDRWKENLITEEEVLECISAEVFEELTDGFHEYTRMKASEVCDCDCVGDVEFKTETEGFTLTATQYEKLADIRSEAPPQAVVTVRRHTGDCSSCTCPTHHRYAAYVAIVWKGLKLHREYTLDAVD